VRSREDLNVSLLFLSVFKLFCFVKKKGREGRRLEGEESAFFRNFALVEKKVPFAFDLPLFVQKKKGHFFALFFESQVWSLSLSLSLSLLPYFNIIYIVCFCCLTSSLSLSLRKQQTAATANANAGATNTTGEGGGGGGGEKTTKTKTKKQCSSVYRGVRQRPWGRCVRKKNSRTKKKEIVSALFFCPSAREDIFALSPVSLSFLFHLFSKKNDRTTFQSLSLYVYLSITDFLLSTTCAMKNTVGRRKFEIRIEALDYGSGRSIRRKKRRERTTRRRGTYAGQARGRIFNSRPGKSQHLSCYLTRQQAEAAAVEVA